MSRWIWNIQYLLVSTRYPFLLRKAKKEVLTTHSNYCLLAFHGVIILMLIKINRICSNYNDQNYCPCKKPVPLVAVVVESTGISLYQVLQEEEGEWLKVIYHPLYGMNNYIWGDWLPCDSLRGSHDSQSPHIRKHLCPILWQLWSICHKIIHTI